MCEAFAGADKSKKIIMASKDRFIDRTFKNWILLMTRSDLFPAKIYPESHYTFLFLPAYPYDLNSEAHKCTIFQEDGIAADHPEEERRYRIFP